MSTIFNINGDKQIHLSSCLTTSLKHQSGVLMTSQNQSNTLEETCFGIVYIPKQITPCYRDYNENKKLLFIFNIAFISDINIDDFDYENLFEMFLNYLGENFDLSMIKKINYFTTANGSNYKLKYTSCNPNLLKIDNSEIIAKYITLFTNINSLLKKFNIKKDIYYLDYKRNECDFNNDREFNNFLENDLENIEKLTKKEKIVTVGKDHVVKETERLLNRTKDSYSDYEKINYYIYFFLYLLI